VFSWDARKARINLEKHGVSFEEAATVFADPEALEWEDASHSSDEERLKRLGCSASGRILILVYTWRRSRNGEETIRLINARRASSKEQKAYFA
jgi:uncharacterized DUF497 family protein